MGTASGAARRPGGPAGLGPSRRCRDRGGRPAVGRDGGGDEHRAGRRRSLLERSVRRGAGPGARRRRPTVGHGRAVSERRVGRRHARRPDGPPRLDGRESRTPPARRLRDEHPPRRAPARHGAGGGRRHGGDPAPRGDSLRRAASGVRGGGGASGRAPRPGRPGRGGRDRGSDPAGPGPPRGERVPPGGRVRRGAGHGRPRPRRTVPASRVTAAWPGTSRPPPPRSTSWSSSSGRPTASTGPACAVAGSAGTS